jgi:hypothetical protein
MKKSVLLFMTVAILTTGSMMLFGQGPVSEKLTPTGTYIVYAVSPQAFRFTVDPKTMGNATVSGHFAVTEGNPKTIDAFIFDDASYYKWRGEDEAAKAGAKPVWSSGRVAQGDVNFKPTAAGNYYLVFSDVHEYEGKKTITTDIKFQYDKK